MTIVAQSNGYVLVPRPDWAKNKKLPTQRVNGPIKNIYIHHTVTRVTDDACADGRFVESILNQRGLAGYNYLVHPSGVVLELAGAMRGEHTGGQNTTSYSISFIGNYDTMQPTLIQVANAARTINLLRWVGAVDANMKNVKVMPHSAVKPTACPGVNIRDQKFAGLTVLQLIHHWASTNV